MTEVNQIKDFIIKNSMEEELIEKQEHLYCSCCCNDKTMLWWFHNSLLGVNVSYEETDYKLYCTCLDWCTVCLILRFNKNFVCREKSVCFLCCCSLNFD
jgi:hypothetical protein